MIDSYLTIATPAQGEYSEKGSKFLAFAFHVESAEEVKPIVEAHRKKYYDARHVCYAYMLGVLREAFRAVDDGEPSGTAGKPILGQLNSRQLTDVLVIVVRYFGGTKLGVSGLINAYKTATADALDNAVVEERTVDDRIEITFEYPLMNQVMKVIKDEDVSIREQDFQMDCRIVVQVRKANTERLLSKFAIIRGVKVERGN